MNDYDEYEEAIKVLGAIIGSASRQQLIEAETVSLDELFAKADEIVLNPIYIEDLEEN